MSLDTLAGAAMRLVPAEGRAILGIAGAPGSGKSTLAEELVAAVSQQRGPDWVAHVPMDGFHLSDAQLERLYALSRKGAPDTFDAAGYAHLLGRLRADDGSPLYVPGFDRDLEQPLAAALFVPASARLVVTEGNYLLLEDDAWPRARAAMSQVWYVSGDEELRHERLVQRHITFGKPDRAARDWVEQTDAPNTALVKATAPRADRHVVNAIDGWRFTGE